MRLIAVIFASLTSAYAQQAPNVESSDQLLRRTMTGLDPKTVELKSGKGKPANRRKFVSYRSSEWEQMWVDNVDKWAEKQEICSVLLVEQAQILHDFLKVTCTRWVTAPYANWCIIDDNFVPLWYNTANRATFEVSFVRPIAVPKEHPISDNEPVTPGPEHDHLMSRFIFFDELTGTNYVEYIEPLISTLRFPLAKCLQPEPATDEYKYHFVVFRGWIIPPPGIKAERAVYFDAGASSWSGGAGGPSLEYFTHMWHRHGIDFDQIQAFDLQTSPDNFYSQVPKEWQGKVHYRQCAVSSSAGDDSEEHPFLPTFINRHTSASDYVLFKVRVSVNFILLFLQFM